MVPRTHKHHIVYKSLGGSNDPSNLIELDFIEHARLHALDFLNGGPMFDCRHDGWPFLDKSLQDAVKYEIGKRTSERNLRNNPIHQEGVLERVLQNRRSYKGNQNPFFGREHTPENRAKMRKARKKVNPSRRSLPLILIHPDGAEEWFSSAAEACKKYGLNKGNLSGVVNGKSPHTKGFRARRP